MPLQGVFQIVTLVHRTTIFHGVPQVATLDIAVPVPSRLTLEDSVGRGARGQLPTWGIAQKGMGVLARALSPKNKKKVHRNLLTLTKIKPPAHFGESMRGHSSGVSGIPIIELREKYKIGAVITPISATNSRPNARPSSRDGRSHFGDRVNDT
jgi:hypothetical protein